MQLNDSEWKLMRALWASGRAGVGELHAALTDETGWAYSTVKTLLERLADKGAVAVERGRAGREFVPLVGEREAKRSAFRALLARAFDGTVESFVHHLIDEGALSKRERAELARRLAELERPGKR
jgi:predicted transcriptional regulator